MAQENNNNDDENPRIGNDIANRPACAACKHQRKKCIQGTCILWTLFPAAEMKEFEAVHKFFGIANVTKLILELDSDDKRVEAARTIKYEAMGRMMDPVQGVTGEVLRLRQRLEMLEEESLRLRQRMEMIEEDNLRLRQRLEMIEEDNLRLRQRLELLEEEKRRLSWLQENPLSRPVHGFTGEDLRLRQKLEMLEEENRQLRHQHTREILRLTQKVEMLKEENRQLRRSRHQESPLPMPVHHHRSGVWVGNTQQSYGTVNGNYAQVFQNNGNMNFEKGVSERVVRMVENQEFRACHGVEGYNCNNSNVGVVGGYTGNSNVRSVRPYESVRTAEIGCKSGIETSIHLRGRYNGPSSTTAKVVYDSGRVFGMEAEGRDGMQLGRSSGAEKSIHRQGEYNGDESIDNCKSAIVNAGYDFLGVENIVNGRSCDVVNVGTSSRIGQSIHHHGGYNGNTTTTDSSNTNERGHNSGGMVVGSGEEYIVNGEGEDVVQTDGTSRTQLSFYQKSGYDSGRIIGMEAAGRNGSNIVNGESSQEGVGVVAQTGSDRRLEQSFQQESVDGDVAAFLPEYSNTNPKE